MSLQGWSQTTFRVRKITLDTSCINQRQADSDLNLLETWAKDGRVELLRSTAMLGELRGEARITKAQSMVQHNEPWLLGVPGRSELGVTTFLGGPQMEAIFAEVLFPTASMLTDNQQADVEHLQSHIHAGSDLFVTKNTNDFIRAGKQERLRELGIWVFDPPGTIQFLRDLYGRWD